MANAAHRELFNIFIIEIITKRKPIVNVARQGRRLGLSKGFALLLSIQTKGQLHGLCDVAVIVLFGKCVRF